MAGSNLSPVGRCLSIRLGDATTVRNQERASSALPKGIYLLPFVTIHRREPAVLGGAIFPLAAK